jgi:HPt (histidine-containing phosphotransfer) domain-containing protein
MGNRGLAERLAREFLREIPSQLELLRKQLEEGDAPSARRQAHTVKGAAANLSAGALRAAALEAERAAEAGQLRTLAELIPSVEQEFERVKDAMGRSGWS